MPSRRRVTKERQTALVVLWWSTLSPPYDHADIPRDNSFYSNLSNIQISQCLETAGSVVDNSRVLDDKSSSSLSFFPSVVMFSVGTASSFTGELNPEIMIDNYELTLKL